MAGSLEMMQHDIQNCDGFTDNGCLIENMGDAWEACEEAVAEIAKLQAKVDRLKETLRTYRQESITELENTLAPIGEDDNEKQ